MKRCIVLGITGGIAAYKSAEIVSRLNKAGCDVHVIMTKNATEFITPLTIETLSHHPVITSMWHHETPWEVEHVSLAKRADLFIVAPATANIIAKMATGIADDMLSTTLLATRAPILLAPAMNVNMYEHPATQENLETLKGRGVMTIGPGSGMLACGDVATGRMSEPIDIVDRALSILDGKQDLKGKRILVTAGPTVEAIDPVRYLTNHSSGRMGYAIAEVARSRGAEVTLVSGPVSLTAPAGVDRVNIQSTQDMYDVVTEQYDDVDAVIMAAAPADYRPEVVADQKIKKAGDMQLSLTRNPDIAKTLGERKEHQKLVIFAAETENMMVNATEKLRRKNADLMVANDVTKEGAGFAGDTNIVTLVHPDGEHQALPQMSKHEVAEHILDALAKLL